MSHHSPGPGWCHTTGSGHIQRDGVRTRVSISVVSHDSCLHGSVHLCCAYVSPMPMPMWPILGFNVDYVSLVQRSARTHNLSQFRVSKYGRWLGRVKSSLGRSYLHLLPAATADTWAQRSWHGGTRRRGAVLSLVSRDSQHGHVQCVDTRGGNEPSQSSTVPGKGPYKTRVPSLC